jgi:hypothetical protein
MACTYGKASQKAWRGKLLKKGASNQTDLQAGDIVLVDQMVSLIPGLAAQIKGVLTTKRYNYATVMLDFGMDLCLGELLHWGSPVFALHPWHVVDLLAWHLDCIWPQVSVDTHFPLAICMD